VRVNSSAMPVLLCPDGWLRASFFTFDLRADRYAKSWQRFDHRSRTAQLPASYYLCIISGTVACSSTWRVTPPRINWRRREWE
jgi:hypothetical protein